MPIKIPSRKLLTIPAGPMIMVNMNFSIADKSMIVNEVDVNIFNARLIGKGWDEIEKMIRALLVLVWPIVGGYNNNGNSSVSNCEYGSNC